MDPDQILALYDWKPGTCFRCPAPSETDTALIAILQPRFDGAKQIRACRECVIVMEESRRSLAEQVGVTYEPGRAGEALT